MDRRGFLRAAAIGVSAAASIGPACRRPPGGASPETQVFTDAFALEETTISDLRDGMSSGRLTARSIVEAYLARIDSMDRQGPALRSLIEVNPDVLTITEQLDRERRQGRTRGPLHGIPVLLKDNIDTHDRMTTTAGSLALSGSVPARDSFVAQRLRAAGAVLLGKANMSEWANIRSSRSTSGWSARGGQCRNPYVLDRNPCGSSSGSAVAVSANLAAVAIGTETDGSIVCPASANGIVGIKPTVGLVSRAGIIPISHSQDTAGPMARTVRDAALLLGAMAGVDSGDTATRTREGGTHDYTTFLDAGGLRGARIGVARDFFGFDERVDRVLQTALDEMSAQGAVLIDPLELRLPREAGLLELNVLLYELKANLNAYLEALDSSVPVRSLEDVIRFNEENRETEMPYFGQDLFLEAEKKGPLSDEVYLQSLDAIRTTAREEGIDAVMEQHRLDAIVAPTGGPAWKTDLVNGDQVAGGSARPAAIAGYPNITVPAGHILGLPIGLSFFGRAWSEPVLLRIAYAFEQATMQRRPPRFLPELTA